jgi:threonine 3-dehydrogenase
MGKKRSLQMKQMRALVKTTPEHTDLKKIPVPEPGENQVLIRVKAAALCGTDLHIYNWNSWSQHAGIQLPVVMGHECCGDVVTIVENVERLRAGDKVVPETHIPCGRCYQLSKIAS